MLLFYFIRHDISYEDSSKSRLPPSSLPHNHLDNNSKHCRQQSGVSDIISHSPFVFIFRPFPHPCIISVYGPTDTAVFYSPSLSDSILPYHSESF